MNEILSIVPYDTTLRDGAQDPRARLSVDKKMAIAQCLDGWGMPYIEGGWPGANEIDTEFFKQAKGMFRNSTFVAFGMTGRIGVNPENDDGLNTLLDAGTDTITLVGKTWLQHVKRALRTEGLPNLETIQRSVAFVRGENRDVIFDAEHWFDGFRQDPEYALEALEAAVAGGASTLVLCDTRGSGIPEFIYEATLEAKKRFPNTTLGIHVHNDSGLALPSTIAAVKAGVKQVQGTINGVGERTGNADLCVVLPIAENKYNIKSSQYLDLSKTTEISRAIEQLNEIPMPDNNPITGRQAFMHKAGLHTSGQQRDPEAYQHMDPKLVGNKTFYIHSEQGGSSNVEVMAEKHGFEVARNDPSFLILVNEMKRLRVLGDAQEYLLLYRTLGLSSEPFNLLEESGIDEDKRGSIPKASANVRVNGATYYEKAEGDGTINAFDLALRRAVARKYPQVNDVTLRDYRITLPTRVGGTAAEVEVYIEFSANGNIWNSRVRGTDQQRAGEDALSDGYKYWILKSQK